MLRISVPHDDSASGVRIRFTRDGGSTLSRWGVDFAASGCEASNRVSIRKLRMLVGKGRTRSDGYECADHLRVRFKRRFA